MAMPLLSVSFQVLLLLFIRQALSDVVDHPSSNNDGQMQGNEHGFISKEAAEKLHILYGGIGPVLVQPDHDASNANFEEIQNGHEELTGQRAIRSLPDEDGQAAVTNYPEQIHISYGQIPSEIVVMWSTLAPGSSEVHYGSETNNLVNTAIGRAVVFTRLNPEGLQNIHRVQLSGLLPNQTYFYYVQTDEHRSGVSQFTTMREGTDWSPTLLVFGDMGVRGGAPSLRILNRAARNQSVDAIIHTGDFAYDLHEEGGQVGDDFMNQIQYVASRLPYMTCVGNHEIASNTFSHYRYRFSMPGVEWPTSIDNMWFSFNMGPVHFIGYSTEVHFTDGPIDAQMEWLQRDLQGANTNRALRPWIIAFGHRPMYCSNNDKDDCTREDSKVRRGFEKLFYDEGVDIIVEAHEHSYERLWPMYQGRVTQRNYHNPQAPVHIIGGAAGCNEFDKVCVDPIFGPRGDWSAFRSWLPGLYGVGKLFVANSTDLHWQQLLAVNEQTLDQFWIHQEYHGPFPHPSRESVM